MSDTTADERNDWSDLIQHPGWLRLVTILHQEWGGTAMDTQIAALADRANDDEALSKLRQFIAAKRAVEKVAGFPASRLAQLSRISTEDNPEHMGRRGAL